MEPVRGACPRGGDGAGGTQAQETPPGQPRPCTGRQQRAVGVPRGPRRGACAPDDAGGPACLREPPGESPPLPC